MKTLNVSAALAFAMLIIGCGQDYTPICMESLDREAKRNQIMINENGNFTVDGWDVSNLTIGEPQRDHSFYFSADVTFRPLSDTDYYFMNPDKVELENPNIDVIYYKWDELSRVYDEWFDSETSEALGKKISRLTHLIVHEIIPIDFNEPANKAGLCYHMDGWCCSDDEGETYQPVGAKVQEIGDYKLNYNLFDKKKLMNHCNKTKGLVLLLEGDENSKRFKSEYKETKATITELYKEVIALGKYNRAYRKLNLEALENIGKRNAPITDEKLIRDEKESTIRSNCSEIAKDLHAIHDFIKQILSAEFAQPTL